MTTAQGFAGSFFCALALFVCLFSNVNRNEIWGRTLWISAALYGITGFLYAYNPYTTIELFPMKAFMGTTCLMLGGVAFSYVMTQSKQLALATNGERQTLLDGRLITFRIMGFGVGWITIVTLLLALYGINEQAPAQSPNYAKQFAQLFKSVEQLFGKMEGIDKVDKRLEKLEEQQVERDKKAEQRFKQIEEGQSKMLNQTKALGKGVRAATNRPSINVIAPTPKTIPETRYAPPPAVVIPPRQKQFGLVNYDFDIADTSLYARQYP